MWQVWSRRAGLAFGTLVITIIAGMSSGAAQSLAQQWTYCNAAVGQYSTEVEIGACTAIIQSRRVPSRNRAAAYVNRGATYADGLHDHARAIADFDQAIRLDPRAAAPFFNRGNSYGHQHDYARAIADYTRAIALNPRWADAFYARGIAYAHSPQHDYARAIADDDAAGQLDPQDANYQNGRCWDRAMANRELDIARAACDRGVQLRPNDADILDSRGMVSLKQQRWQDAFNDYDAAAGIDATDAGHLYGRGIARLRLGQTPQGQADLAHAAQLDANIATTYAGYGITP